MTKVKTKAKISPKVKVEKVEEPTVEIEKDAEEMLFMVRLDSKRFESRTLEQVLSLVEGSVGVVSRVTIERS